MPRIIGTKRQITGQPKGQLESGVGYKMRVYKPSGPIDRIYRNKQQMMRYRRYYKEQGFRTRKI